MQLENKKKFKFLLYLALFLPYFSFNKNTFSAAYCLEDYSTNYCVLDEEPIVITRNDTVIKSGNYILLARNDINSMYLSISQEYRYGVGDIVLIFTYSTNVTFSVSFTRSFPGSEQINNSGLVIASIPISINSSQFLNWTIYSFIVASRYQSGSVVLYYVTSHTFTRLPGNYSGINDEFVFSGNFQGNGTYTFLGEIKEPQPLWTSPYVLIGIGIFAIQLVIIAIIVKYAFEFFFGKNDE